MKYHNDINVIKTHFSMQKLMYRASPIYYIAVIIITILGALINSIKNTILIKFLTDSMYNSRDFKTVCTIVLLLFVLWGSLQLLKCLFCSILEPIFFQKFTDVIQKNIFEKTIRNNINKYDDPTFYNDFVLILNNADKKTIESYKHIVNIIYNLTSVSAMIVLVGAMDVIGLIFALINVVVAYYINIKTSEYSFAKQTELLPYKRLTDYILDIYCSKEYSKEIRISNIGKVLKKDYMAAVEGKVKTIRKYSKRLILLNCCNHALFRTFLMRGVYIIILAYKLIILKSISCGEFLALFNGAWEFKNSLENILKTATRLRDNSRYIEKYHEYINQTSEIKELNRLKVPESCASIEFRNVYFKYNQNSDYVLKNINLIINPKEKIAIYGFNGAGKTTLIKLLLRLYEVTKGNILLNGESIYSYDLDEYYKYIGAVFQDFKLFAFSIAENIMLDNCEDSDLERIKKILCHVGLTQKMESLNWDINKSITKEFNKNGVVFSGGELQRIAIARTMAYNFRIVVLDEPISALDPFAEYDINKLIWETTLNKTVICISHRINSNVKADKIIFMKDGELVDDPHIKKLFVQE